MGVFENNGKLEVVTAKSAGYCFGVSQAVGAAYEEAAKIAPDAGKKGDTDNAELNAGKKGDTGNAASGAGAEPARAGDQNAAVVTFGPIIHNEVVVEDLRRKGVGVVTNVDEIHGGTVIIRSHGVSKEIFDEITRRADRVVDATCTFVKRIHEIVESQSRGGKQIVIIGNHGHAEVEGTMGWCVPPCDKPVVIETHEEAEHFEADPGREICVVAQTTFHGTKFEELVAILRKKGYNVSVNNTICGATRLRQTEARTIAQDADVMIVIGGKGSSNTAKLYEICKAECERTFYVQTVDDLQLTLSENERKIGITAGASTPKNIIEEVQNNVRRTDF